MKSKKIDKLQKKVIRDPFYKFLQNKKVLIAGPADFRSEYAEEQLCKDSHLVIRYNNIIEFVNKDFTKKHCKRLDLLYVSPGH
jgi:hypothetical protein